MKRGPRRGIGLCATFVASLALASTPAHAAAPADSSEHVLIAPIEADGLAPADVERLHELLAETLDGHGIELERVSVDRDCERECLAELGERHAADSLVRVTVEAAERDYAATLEIYSFDGADQPASYEIDCHVCGFGEFSTALRERASLARTNVRGLAELSISGSPERARLSIEGQPLGSTLPTVARLEPGHHELLVEHNGYEPRALELVLEPGARESVFVQLEPIMDEARTRALIPLGAALLGAGVGGIATGIGLTALHGSPVRSRCASPTTASTIDADGDCRWVHDTVDAGVTTTVLAAAATVTGATVLAIGIKRCEADPDCRKHELGILIGPTRVGVGLHF